MLRKAALIAIGALMGTAIMSANAYAVDVPVVGTVASKCVVVTDTNGVYGNPSPAVLSTAAADGGVEPIIRFDVIQANFYKASITYPNAFSESPALDDVLNWTGGVSVAEVSDAGMSAYDQNKVTFNNVTEVDLTIAGSTWFKVESRAEYGANKALPAGTYRAIVQAECIAL
jgi:hypothetical protein